jgi:uncharacterized protein (TIGR02145 family)
MGTRIDSTTKTGKYQGSFIVKLVANAIPYSIVYDGNVVSNMPTDVSSTTPDTSVTIDSKVPVRAGYKFLGWCNGTVTNTNGADSCNGTVYNPNGDGTNLTYTLDQTGGSNALSLTAMWGEPCAGYTKMQDMTTASAATLLPNIGSTATVCDTRDDQTYTIAKLNDNKYWMIENLNLAGNTALSANDTDVTSEYISSFPASNNLTKTGDTIVLPASSTSGFDTNNYSYVYNSGNTTNCGASSQNTPCYSYYSWDAATLGSGRTIATDNTDAEQSICPKGWKLPSTYYGSGIAAEATDFRKLMIGYGGSNSIQTYNSSTTPTGATMYGRIGPGTTPNYLLAGLYSDGSFYDGGSYGTYWSSTSYSSTSYAHYLYFYSGSVNSANYNTRRSGFSVRCLFSGQ